MKAKRFISILVVVMMFAVLVIPASAASAPTLSSDTTKPTTIVETNTFSLKGTIYFNGTNARYVYVTVYDPDDPLNQDYPHAGEYIDSPSTYNINRLDADIKFDELPPGEYRYAIGYTPVGSVISEVILDQSFTVVAPTITFTEDSTYPPPRSLSYGQAYPVRGIASSNGKIDTVTITVSGSNGTVYTKATATSINSKTYDIRNLDSQVLFNVVPKGTHQYTISIKSGHSEKVCVYQLKVT